MGDVAVGILVSGALVAAGFIAGVAWYMIYTYVQGAL